MTDIDGYSAGIDLGSAFVKAVVFKGKQIVSTHVAPMQGIFTTIAEEALNAALAKADILFESLEWVASTGYGEYNLSFSHKAVNPLTAGACGAYYLLPTARTVIDFGINQSSVLRLDDQGNIIDNIISEKCASGSGWLLSVIARILGVGIEKLGGLSLGSDNPVTLTSDCAVFAETEVISRISEGNSREDIVAGVHRILADRIKSLVDRVGLTQDCVLIGGGARDAGLLKRLDEILDCEIKVIDKPQFESAIGAVIYWQDGLT
ncbi:MAG: hypothetical protein JXB42_05285 [Deltaproteobacteria bacterium]|nr:hypothetical protein [Deltaproteobacteria bacterium]